MFIVRIKRWNYADEYGLPVNLKRSRESISGLFKARESAEEFVLRAIELPFFDYAVIEEALDAKN
jgi:hypothetical protein